MRTNRGFSDPWAEYGKPITFISATLEPHFLPEIKGIPTITQLEALLDREDELMIEILPNGSIATRELTDKERGGRKPLTMRENLGGEYAAVKARVITERAAKKRKL
jgi:hypothetical protein